MKKNLLSIIFILTSLLTSCNKDDDGEPAADLYLLVQEDIIEYDNYKSTQEFSYKVVYTHENNKVVRADYYESGYEIAGYWDVYTYSDNKLLKIESISTSKALM